MQPADDNPLLATKLYLPRPRLNLVPRPRLTARLNQAQTLPLTLLAAPAGFGKTTLLSEWIPTSEQCVCWLSLDDGDNDPVRFWMYFVAALQTLDAQLGANALALLRSPQPPPVESILTPLINDLSTFHDRFSLVLDDYHAIMTQAIHVSVASLLDHLPPNVQVVITSRIDPPLPLARLRARGHLAELRAADLRFTPDEASAFLNDVMGLKLSADEVAALEARTEGWIAGLQLAALAMRDRDDAAGFIASFTGSNRYILSYLVEEVLNRQPEHVQTFLLHTSILDRMTASLCDAVLGKDEDVRMKDEGTRFGFTPHPSSFILDYLEQSNLFLVPLDDERRWYRYHHLFGEVLRGRMQAAHADRVPELHTRAAEWFERDGWVAEAIRHALAAKDWERAVRLIAQTADATAFTSGQLNTVFGWLQVLPPAVLRAQPRLSLTRAWMLLNAGSIEAVEEHLVDAERASTALEAAQARTFQGEIAALRAVAASYRREISRTIELCRQAFELLSEDNAFLRAAVAHALGIAYRFSGRVVEASQAFSDAIALGRAAGNFYIMMDSVTNLASMQMIHGRLHAAAQTCREALQFADEQTESGGHQLFDAGFAHIRLGAVLLEWSDLDTAAWHVAKGIELGRQGGNLDIVMTGHGFLARVKQAQGDPAGASAAMRTIEQMAPAFHNRFLVIEVGAFGARLSLARGDLESAAHWARDYAAFTDADPAYLGEFAKIAVARVHLVEKRFAEALELLERLRADAETAERIGSAIEILALEALTLEAQGEHVQAVTTLERALALAEPEGYVRLFVDEGEPMKKVIGNWRLEIGRTARHETARRLLVYTEKLLAAFGPPPQLPVTHDQSPRPGLQSPLVESLSEREIEVLRLIADGLSNREIAEQLIVGTGTVKTHINNIYRKLDVKSRTQAIHRARELGLL